MTNKIAEKWRKIAETAFREVDNYWHMNYRADTNKRLREAESGINKGTFFRKLAKAADCLAEGHERGLIPPELAGIKTKADLEAALYNPTRLEAFKTALGFDLNTITHSPEIHNWMVMKDILLRGIPSLYPTPPALIGEMFQEVSNLGDYHAGQTVLEPSAGLGHIAWEVRNAYPGVKLKCIEIDWQIATYLENEGFSVDQEDFMNWEPDGPIHHIIMNPPFEKKQDVIHILRAMNMVEEGGTVIAIASVGLMTNNDKATMSLRDMVNHWNEGGGYGRIIKNNDDAFKDSDRPTSIRTCRVILQKPVTVPKIEMPVEPIKELVPVREIEVLVQKRLF